MLFFAGPNPVKFDVQHSQDIVLAGVRVMTGKRSTAVIEDICNYVQRRDFKRFTIYNPRADPREAINAIA